MNIILENYLLSTKWIKFKEPFPHLRAFDVFNDQYYRELVTAFNSHIDPINIETSLIHTHAPNYDAYIFNVNEHTNSAFDVFLSKEWHDLLGSIFDVFPNGCINVALHYHKKGSRTGWIHNDLASGWFVDKDTNGRLNVYNPSENSYTDKTMRISGLKSTEHIRCLTMIYYLNNEQKSVNDGGCTALFSNKNDKIEDAAVLVPPINNSLLVFPCTPYSFHTFISNKKSSRSSIILWLHTDKNNIVSRFGENQIVKW